MNKDFLKKSTKVTFVSSAQNELSEFQFSDYENSAESEQESEDCFEDSKELLTDDDTDSMTEKSSSLKGSKRSLRSPEEDLLTKRYRAIKKQI